MGSVMSADETWVEAVLRIIEERSGPISLQEIYQRIERHPLVTPDLMELWGGQPMYQHNVRTTLASLKKAGKIFHPARGIYESR